VIVLLLFQHPEMLVSIVRGTPVWVAGLFVGVVAMGVSQARDRTVGLQRALLTPFVMTAFSIWGMVTAFRASPHFAYVMVLWLVAAVVAFRPVAAMGLPRGASFDAATQRLALPGSWVPLSLILGIFVTKWVVGVDLAMEPRLALNGQYTLLVGTTYGIFSGLFAGRVAQLWRLFRPHSDVTLLQEALQ